MDSDASANPAEMDDAEDQTRAFEALTACARAIAATGKSRQPRVAKTSTVIALELLRHYNASFSASACPYGHFVWTACGALSELLSSEIDFDSGKATTRRARRTLYPSAHQNTKAITSLCLQRPTRLLLCVHNHHSARLFVHCCCEAPAC